MRPLSSAFFFFVKGNVLREKWGEDGGGKEGETREVFYDEVLFP
jgi:hypothetical protein